jgi:hypothetical protein
MKVRRFKSEDASLENLSAIVPSDKASYEIATTRNKLNNFQEFFKNSYAEEIKLLDESISFQRPFGGRVSFEVVNSGPKDLVYALVDGPIILENKDMAEVMFLTKIIGNYNITKISDTFIFENSDWAVSIKRKQ